MHRAVSRYLFEVSLGADLPPHVWACSMLYYHAYQEYSSDRDHNPVSASNFTNALVVGVSCLVLSVKANESYLNTMKPGINHVQRLQATIEAAARCTLSYTVSSASTEKIVQLKRKLKDFVPVVELAIMRVIGNSLEPTTAFTQIRCSQAQAAVLIEIYSNPLSLNYPPEVFCDLVSGPRTCATDSIIQILDSTQ
jgi:hypothetical protein